MNINADSDEFECLLDNKLQMGLNAIVKINDVCTVHKVQTCLLGSFRAIPMVKHAIIMAGIV